MHLLFISLLMFFSFTAFGQDLKGLQSIYCNKLSSLKLIQLATIKTTYSQVKQVAEQFKPVLDKMPEAQKQQIFDKLKEQDISNQLNLLCKAIDTDCDFDSIQTLDGFVSEIDKIQSIAEAFVKSSAEGAINQSVDCLSVDPKSIVLNFNFALSLSFADDNKKSIETFLDILNDMNNAQTDLDKDRFIEFKFYTLFNLGVLYSQESQIEKALEYYQLALEMQPESKEIKTNIELLFQQQQQQQQQGENSQKGNQGDNKDQNNQQEQDQKDQQNEKNPDNKQDQNKQNQEEQDFKSKNLSKEDVRKILEELKNQENKIRMNEYQKGDKSQENDNGKNW